MNTQSTISPNQITDILIKFWHFLKFSLFNKSGKTAKSVREFSGSEHGVISWLLNKCLWLYIIQFHNRWKNSKKNKFKKTDQFIVRIFQSESNSLKVNCEQFPKRKIHSTVFYLNKSHYSLLIVLTRFCTRHFGRHKKPPIVEENISQQ